MIHDNKPSLEEAVVHFGAKGMHWGIRKAEDKAAPSGPSAKQQKRETKAQGFQIRADVANVHIAELSRDLKALPPGLKTAYKRSSMKQDLQLQTAHRDQLLKDSEAARSGKLTSNQKKLIIGGIAVAAIVGVLAVGVMKESGQGNSLMLRGQAALSGKKFEFKKDASLAGKMSPMNVLNKVGKQVNPNYSQPGGKMNCRRSTFTHELRRRGFDVHATTSETGFGQSESGLINAITTRGRDRFGATSVSQMIVGGKGVRGQISGDSRVNPVKTLLSVKIPVPTRNVSDAAVASSSHKAIRDALMKQPDGSRGEVLFNFRQFGHSMAYEVFDGKPMIFDSQKGVMYDMAEGLGKLTEKWGRPIGLDITRLDNLPLDMKFLSRWATNN